VCSLGGDDGLNHITYAYVDANGNSMVPDANAKADMEAAVQEWNNNSATTGIEIDPMPAGQDPSVANIQVTAQTSETNTGGCAAYTPSSARLNYGPTFLQAVSGQYAIARVGTTILAHELGHALGLADAGSNPTTATIMNNPSNSPPYNCTNPNVPTTAVQSNDESVVNSCRSHARGQTTLANIRAGITLDSIPGTATITTPPPVSCTYFYGTTNFYVNGVYQGYELYIENIVCSA
jgi:hypothetical protein